MILTIRALCVSAFVFSKAIGRTAGVAFALGCMVAESSAQLPLTLPRGERPSWLADEGLVMAGSWEPLLFRVRRDGGEGFTATPEQRAAYEREHSPEMIAQLKALGVNFIMMHCYKGGGLVLERESMADAVLFAQRCRDAGIRVGVYAYSGALLWEPMLKEIPSAWEWFLLDAQGEPQRYYDTTYRYRWNRNHPGAMAFYKGIIRFAVEEVKADLIHLDNHSTGPGFDGNSQQRFRAYLAAKFTKEQLGQMGVEDVAKVTPPLPGNSNALLGHAWADFRSQSVADAYYEISRHARSLRPNILMEINPGGVGPSIRGSMDHGRALQGGEAFWTEGEMQPWRGTGRLQTNIMAYKFARRMDNMMFRYVTTPLQLAEAMAFNLDALGCLVAFEYANLTDFPGAKGKLITQERAPFVKFFRERRELFKHTEVTADTALLRNFPSQAFGPAERRNTSSQVAEELIATRAAFQVIADVHLAELNRYRVLVLPDCMAMSDEHVRQIRAFVAAGGSVCVIGPLATHDEWMLPRKQPALGDLPAARVFQAKGPKDVPAAIERALGNQTLRVWAKNQPAGTATSAAGDPFYGLCVETTRRGGQQFVHLVNYRDGASVENISIRLRVAGARRVKSVTLASPEARADAMATFTQEGEFVTFEVARVGIYAIAVVSTE